jgi:predicted transcriptional regulator
MNSLMTEEIENDVLFVTEKNNNVWWYDGQRIVFRTQTYDKILRTLQRDNRATLAILQQEVGVNRSALQKMLARLQEKRYVERDDKGGWRVFITPSV